MTKKEIKAMTSIERKRHDETLKNWSTAKSIYLTGKNLGMIFTNEAVAREVCKILNDYITWGNPYDVVKAFNLDAEYLGFMIIDRQNTGHMFYPAPDILKQAEINVKPEPLQRRCNTLVLV